MQEKMIHIVFQVLNFLHSDDSTHLKLLPIDKLILINLASHKGRQGIFPMQETIASELKTSLRYIKTRLKFLEKNRLISVQKINKKNSYLLPFLSTIGDPQITQEEIKGDPQITLKVIHRSPHRGSTDATNNKVSNKIRESAKKPRSSLSDSWLPNAENQSLAEEIAAKVGNTAGWLLAKFRGLQKSKDATSSDWNATFEYFLLTERAPVVLNNGAAVAEPPRPKLRDYTAERLKREEEEAKTQLKAVEDKPKPVTNGLSLREMLKQHYLKQGALPNGKDNQGGGTDSH